jgi:DNA gyrase subunit B
MEFIHMEKDYDAEIDNLKEEIKQIKDLLQANMPKTLKESSPNKIVGHIHKQTKMHPDPNIMAILDKLENLCGLSDQTGCLTYVGVFESGGRQSTWIRNEINTDELLSLIENKMAVKVLACIGNNDRMNILLSILRKPKTVAQLVAEYGFGSTGQVYHHLKPLIAADLVIEDSKNEGKGAYVIQPHRVQGIIMLLAGISDMLDPKYTQGNWEADQDE